MLILTLSWAKYSESQNLDQLRLQSHFPGNFGLCPAWGKDATYLFVTISTFVVSWDVLQVSHPSDSVPPLPSYAFYDLTRSKHLMACVVGKNTV